MVAAELIAMVATAARSWGHKELFCAPDVMEAVSRETPMAGEAAFADSLRIFTGVIITVTPDSPPGSFRLVKHYDSARSAMTCEVRDGRVVHEKCMVVAEGVLSA